MKDEYGRNWRFATLPRDEYDALVEKAGRVDALEAQVDELWSLVKIFRSAAVLAKTVGNGDVAADCILNAIDKAAINGGKNESN